MTTTSTIGTLTIDGKEYAVIPLDDYQQAEAEMLPDESIEQDLGDIAECRRRDADAGPSIPLDEVVVKIVADRKDVYRRR